MTPEPVPKAAQARDRKELAIVCVVALALAGCLFVLFVLPAEFGRDPTGFGRLTGIGDLSGGGNEVDLGDRLATVHRSEPGLPRNDTVTLTLTGLGDELEYKFHLVANQSMLYAWTASSAVEFDFHGEPDAPSQPGEFSSYEARQAGNRSGSFQAPFDGRHGWYFRNVSDGTVTITLQTWGYYEVVGRI